MSPTIYESLTSLSPGALNCYRITLDPLVMSGHPCIRGMRVTVSNVLRLLAVHHSRERILEAYPYLEVSDIDACLEYAALLVDMCPDRLLATLS